MFFKKNTPQKSEQEREQDALDILKKYIPLNETTSFKTISPFLNTAYRKYILPYLSIPLASKVEKHWEKSNIPNNIQNLLPYIQEANAHFAFVLFIPTAQLKVSDAGIHRVEDSNQLTAYRYQIQDLINSHTEQAWFAIDELLKFLEENQRDYPEWATSESSIVLKSNFIQTATDFGKYADIQDSRRLFYALKPTMNRMEKTFVQAALGELLYNKLKEEVQKDRIVSRMEKLLEFIKPAVALLTLANSSTDLVIEWYGKSLVPTSYAGEKASQKAELQMQLLQNWKNEKENAGMTYLNRLKKYLMQYAPLYPEYPIPTEKINNNGAIFSF